MLLNAETFEIIKDAVLGQPIHTIESFIQNYPSYRFLSKLKRKNANFTNLIWKIPPNHVCKC